MSVGWFEKSHHQRFLVRIQKFGYFGRWRIFIVFFMCIHFPCSIGMFEQSCHAFHPVARIEVMNSINHSVGRLMYVSANDPICMTCTGKCHQLVFVIGNVRNCRLYFLLNALRKREILQAFLCTIDCYKHGSPISNMV